MSTTRGMPNLRWYAHRAWPLSFLLVLMLQFVVVAPAWAQARAWLDRDRIGAGETVTLNVETTEVGAGPPDFSPLERDFVVSGNTSRREFEMRNGRATVRASYGVALRPRRDGVLTVPALRVGGARTAALTVVVARGASVVPPPARAGDNVFIESQADDETPYVQQAVGWVVRLYSAVPLVSGQLDQPAPEGATLQRVGTDAQYTRDVGGRRYIVVERRFLLLPERSGSLTIPGATFEGRGTGGFFDDLMGGRGGALSAGARPRFLQVSPPPANAPQPWLPLHALTLRYRSTPSGLRVGAASDVELEITADGATTAQMPDVKLPPMAGVQVFPAPVQTDESFTSGRPQVKQVRRFSLVPTRPGAVVVPALEVAWWDVGSGSTRRARVPALRLSVAAAPGVTGTPAPAATRQSSPLPAEAVATPARRNTGVVNNPWVVATVAFAVLWLVTLLWWIGRQRGHGPAVPAAPGAGVGASRRDASPGTATGLRRALAEGDLGEISDALMALAPMPCGGMAQLRDMLEDPRQRAALDLLEQARWSHGDVRAARHDLREAFAHGPTWRVAPSTEDAPLLPPLYPRG